MASRGSQIRILIIVFVVFFSPLLLYYQSYNIDVTSSGRSVSLSSFKGWNTQAGISWDYFHKNRLDGPYISLKKYRTVNLGVYTNITIELMYDRMVDGKRVQFELKSSFTALGPGLAGNKKQVAEKTILGAIDSSISSITKQNR